MNTAEWICTHCQTTNRILVAPGVTEIDDRCFSCHRRHRITKDPRPVRWSSTVES